MQILQQCTLQKLLEKICRGLNRSFLVSTCVLKQPLHSLLTECVDGVPVVLMNSEPLAVTRPNVDVDGAEVVVLLMT